MHKHTWVAVGVLLLLFGCSSTHSPAGSRSKGGRTASPTVGGETAEAGTQRSRSQAEQGRSTRGGGSISGTGDGAASGGPVTGRPAGRGATSGEPVKLGIHVSANAAAASSFGVALPQHSTENIDAVVQWINDNGGIADRPVEAVYHTTDPMRGSFDQQAQAACTAFTQDHEVAFVVSAAQLYRDTLPACLAQNGVPLIWGVYYLTSRTVVPPEYLYRPSHPHGERLGFFIDGLAGQGFLQNAKLGLVRWDSPKEQRVTDRVLKPRLAAHGVDVSKIEETHIREAESAAGAGQAGSEIGNAILRFRRADVSHVIFVPSGGALPLLFLPAAESQRYHPRYGLSTLDAPYFVRDSVPHRQLQDAAGVGWAPGGDVGPDDPRTHEHAATSKRCVGISQRAGYSPNQAPYSYCDLLFFLRAALAEHDPTVDGLRRGTEGLGDRYTSVISTGTRFGPGRHDGLSGARHMRFTSDWEYVGRPFPVD